MEANADIFILKPAFSLALIYFIDKNRMFSFTLPIRFGEIVVLNAKHVGKSQVKPNCSSKPNHFFQAKRLLKKPNFSNLG